MMLENVVSSIWDKTIGINSSSFFELLGNTAKAQNFLHEFNKETHHNLTLFDFWSTPTVKGIIQRNNSKSNKSTSTHSFPLTHSQKAQVLKQKYSQSYLPENMAIEFSIPAYLLDNTSKALVQLYLKHQSLQMYVREQDDDYFLQQDDKWKDTIHLDLFSLNKVNWEKTKIEYLNFNCNIFQGPLLKTAINIKNGGVEIYMVFNQLIFDHSNEKQIEKDFLSFLAEDSTFTPIKSIGDFAYQEQQYLSSPQAIADKNYWLGYIKKTNTNIFNVDYPYPINKLLNLNYEDSLQYEIANYCIEDTKEVTNTISGVQSSFKPTPAGIYRFSKSADFIHQQQEVAIEIGVSPYIILLGIFHIQLSNWSNTTNPIIGNCISLRDEDYEQTLGFFTNIIFTQVDTSKKITTEEYFFQIMEDFFEGYEHKNYPWEKVIQDTNISFNEVSKLFLDFIDKSEYTSPQKKEEEIIEQGAITFFDINCFIEQYSDLLVIECTYNNELYKPETIQKFFNETFDLFSKISDDITKPLTSLLTKTNEGILE